MTKGEALSSRERLALLSFLGTVRVLDNGRDLLRINRMSAETSMLALDMRSAPDAKRPPAPLQGGGRFFVWRSGLEPLTLSARPLARSCERCRSNPWSYLLMAARRVLPGRRWVRPTSSRDAVSLSAGSDNQSPMAHHLSAPCCVYEHQRIPP